MNTNYTNNPDENIYAIVDGKEVPTSNLFWRTVLRLSEETERAKAENAVIGAISMLLSVIAIVVAILLK